ncbi:MAG: CGNR zinc finger domain-containing protein [Candidatus Limnocylindrales bacterium]
METVTPGKHAHDIELHDTFDFLNTYELQDRLPIDHFGSLSVALDWFVDRGVIHLEGADGVRAVDESRPAIGEQNLSRIRSVRRALRELADAIVEVRVPDSAALATVNRSLHARQVIELVAGPDGWSVDHRHVGDPIDDALARIADPMVRELADGHPHRIRVCANDRCQRVFYDGSRSGRRRWCDMTTCGNRAKAARYRARGRSANEPATEPATEVGLQA